MCGNGIFFVVVFGTINVIRICAITNFAHKWTTELDND